MFSKSTWLHLRIPFSFFLMPVFLYALALTTNINPIHGVIVFIALHLFLYPASNGYNSYFDKDEKSIGGLKNPPQVKKELYWTAILFDLFALLLGLFNWQFMLMLIIYGLVSKAYSHPSIRLKKYPFVSWLVAGFFQGFFTFMMVYVGLTNGNVVNFLQPNLIFAAALTSIMLWGSYPMTQIYQHEEDSKRGDITLSLILGIRNTFHFTMIMFGIATILFLYFFLSYYGKSVALIYLLAMMPVTLYFLNWYIKARKNEAVADFDHTMRLNALSATFLNGFFIWLWLH